MDSGQTKDGIMYAVVPDKGIKTLYPIIGDLLGWLSIIIMFLLIGLFFFQKRMVNSDKAVPL